MAMNDIFQAHKMQAVMVTFTFFSNVPSHPIEALSSEDKPVVSASILKSSGRVEVNFMEQSLCSWVAKAFGGDADFVSRKFYHWVCV